MNYTAEQMKYTERQMAIVAKAPESVREWLTSKVVVWPGSHGWKYLSNHCEPEAQQVCLLLGEMARKDELEARMD